MASLVNYMYEGEAVEVGIVGREGVPEALHLLGPALLQTTCFMQVQGTGLRMKFGDFQQIFEREEGTRKALLRFVQFQSLVLGQVAACNRLHEVEQRLARWLLMASDRTGDSQLRLTQEFLSQMLGARCSTVTLVAGALQGRGLIEYSRGAVRILNREGLEGTACECYGIVQKAMQRLADFKPISSGPLPLPPPSSALTKGARVEVIARDRRQAFLLRTQRRSCEGYERWSFRVKALDQSRPGVHRAVQLEPRHACLASAHPLQRHLTTRPGRSRASRLLHSGAA